MSMTEMRKEISRLRHANKRVVRLQCSVTSLERDLKDQRDINADLCSTNAKLRRELAELRTALDKHQHADKEANPTITALNDNIFKQERKIYTLETQLHVMRERADRQSASRREMFHRLCQKNKELRDTQKELRALQESLSDKAIPHSPVCDSNVDMMIAEINERLSNLENIVHP
jgi:chromosome segregation ATPase